MKVATERDEREAGFLAREIPADARIVGLLFPSDIGPRAAAAADAIATSLGRRRERTLLASCERDGGWLDEAIGGAERRGLHAVLEGRVKLREIAVRREDRSFVYLPAGEGAPPADEILATRAFGGFVERVRDRGGTLLLHLPVEEAGGAVCELLDGCLALGDIEAVATRPIEVPCWGRVAFDERGTDAPPEVAPEEGGPEPSPTGLDDGVGAGDWSSHRARTDLPWGRLALGALGLLALMAAWWFVTQVLLNAGPASRPAEPLISTVAAPSVTGATLLTDEAALALADRAPELGYSVLIASYAARSDAEERLAEIGARPGELFFLAPTPVRGAIYYRVFAGALGDPGAGRELMNLLVASGRKDGVSDWDVRPARFAFRLAVFAYPDTAGAALRRALADSIPAYLLPASREADIAYQLWAGAYESEGAASAMAALLERREWEAELRPRRGEAR